MPQLFSSRKKKRVKDRDMVKLKDDANYYNGAENEVYKEKSAKKNKMKIDYDDFGSTNKLLTAGHGGGVKTKRRWKRATRKSPTYVHHENIYDLDEVDSKFEGIPVLYHVHSLQSLCSIFIRRSLFG